MKFSDLDLGEYPAWMDQAACATADPDAFTSGAVGAAVLCIACPVVRACAQHADEHDERIGVWGGIDRQRVN